MAKKPSTRSQPAFYYALLATAVDCPEPIQIPFKTKNEAVAFRFAIYRARNAYTNDYPGTIKAEAFSLLKITIRNSDPDKWYVVLAAPDQALSSIQFDHKELISEVLDGLGKDLATLEDKWREETELREVQAFTVPAFYPAPDLEISEADPVFNLQEDKTHGTKD